KGYNKETEHTVCFAGNFYGSNAERLIKAGVKQGDVLSIIGDFDSKEYFRKDPNDKDPNSTAKTYHDRSLEVKVLDWSYAPQNRQNNDSNGNSAPAANQGTNFQAPQTPPAQNYTPGQNAMPQQNYQQGSPQQTAPQQGYTQPSGQANYQQGTMNYQQPMQQPAGTAYPGNSSEFSSFPQQQLPFQR
ncbi:MAG: hypothetical protein PHN80_13805, partial [Hespellia sp.]|nr:hypothetical protein [Hespellia sp.]